MPKKRITERSIFPLTVPEWTGSLVVLLLLLGFFPVMIFSWVVPQEFSARYRNFRETLERNFERIAEHVPKRCSLSAEQRLLLGAYVTCEYLVESATLFIAQE